MDLRALVVCPDQDSATLLTLILSELGMAAEHTPSISRGLELVDSQHFDAIVLDYRADRSSEEFFARLRQSAKNRASMLIAVVDGEFNARPVFGLGANFILYRPLSSERTRISLRAARNLMRRERRRAPRAAVSSTANVAYPGAPELSAAKTRVEELLSFWPGEYQIFDLETKQAVLTASDLSDVAEAMPVSNCAE